MHLSVASPGWPSSSSPLWIPISVVVALAVGMPLIWLTWKLVFDRKRLDYSVLTTPLVNHDSKFAQRLLIYYGQDPNPINDPQIVRIRLSSRSGKDIGKGDFDGDPLIIELHATVIAILADSRTGSREPSIALANTEVYLQPGLIRKKSIRTIEVLTVGQPSVSIEPSILNCNITERAWIYSSQESSWKEQWFFPVSFALAILVALIVGNYIINMTRNNSKQPNPVPTVSFISPSVSTSPAEVFTPPPGPVTVPGIVPSSTPSRVKSSSSP